MNHKNWLRQVIPLFFLLGFALSASARVERLDDSTSPRTHPTPVIILSGDGIPLDLAEHVTETLMRFGRIDYRLYTGSFVGKQARIYFVVPASIPGLRDPNGIQVEWQGNGLFSSGIIHPGERVLVWQGTIRDEWMQEGLNVDIRTKVNAVYLPSGAALNIDSYFEIEV